MHNAAAARVWIKGSEGSPTDMVTSLEDHFIFKAACDQDLDIELSRPTAEYGPAKVGNSFSLKNPEKVGIGTWDFDAHGTALKDLDTFDFNWYTNWKSEPLWSPNGKGVADARFVPMIFGRADVTTSNVNALKEAKSGHLLTFNEPDNKDQADLTVKEALKLWPQLLKTGLEIGSPACTTSETLGKDSWLGKFMNQADKKGYDVDFVSVHYYSDNPSIAEFKKFLNDVHKAYDKPVWVTEWALVDWENEDRFSAKKLAKFAEAATRMMDELKFVERHAWFGAYDGGDGWHINTELLDARGSITDVGQTFHDLLL